MNAKTQTIERNGCLIELPRIHPSGAGDITEDEAVIYTGISKRKLFQMRKDNEGPPYRKFGVSVRYPLAGLNEYLEACLHIPSR